MMAVVLVSCTREELSESVSDVDNSTSTEVSDVFVSGEVNVYLSEEMTAMIEEAAETGSLTTKSPSMNNALEELGITEMSRVFPHAGKFEARTRAEGLHRWYTVKYSQQTPRTKAQECLEGVPGIEVVEPVRQIKIYDFNDLTDNLWGLDNKTNPDFDINVKQVWNEYTTGNAEVIVSVVDNGIDLQHEDLAENCLTTGHYNAVDDNSIIVPGDHGTHVAGTIAAVGNNGKGIVGVAGGDKANGKSGVKLLSCQIFKTTSNGGTQGGNSANAIKWGADHGAVISQNSWGYSYDYDGDGKLAGDEMQDALKSKTLGTDKAAIDYFIKYAGYDENGKQIGPMAGGVVIFAAGNDAITNSAPAEYEKVIAVGSVAQDGIRSSFSNYGAYVDICAPGSGIYSTLPGNEYGNMNGTSMACPHVSGVAALIVSHFGGPGFTNEMLKEKLLGSANKSVISQAYQIGGLVDAYGAFAYGNDKAPSKVTDLAIEGRGNNIDFTWTVPADEDGKAAYGFMIIYDTDKTKVEKATMDNLGGAKYITVTPDAKAGEKVSYSLSKLAFETEYSAKMVAYSYGRNYSEATSVMSATTTKNNAPTIEVKYDGDWIIMPSETINATVIATEPDSHEMTVDLVKGSDAETLSSNPDGTWKLTIKGNAAHTGTYTSKIVATDEYGLSTTKAIEYTIRENQAPVKKGDPENIFMKAKGEEATIDMSQYITDPDGEQLKYEVAISNAKVAHVTPKGNNLIVTGLAYGSTDVTVTASDARGEKVEASFKILIKDPSDPISVYPNPVVDYVNVGTLDEADTKIVITGQTGKKVYDETVKASAFNPARIDMTGCAPGIYVIAVTLNGKEYKETITKI